MKDGIINIGTPAADALGFTSDKFHEDSYLWKKGDSIYISFIESVSPGKSDFRGLVEKIRSLGLTVKIPTPFSRMEEICRKNGYQHSQEDFDDTDGEPAGTVNVWSLPPITQELEPQPTKPT